jgi:Uma2 family endonuclease
MSIVTAPPSARAARPAEQRVVLRGVSWETYERLLAERGDAGSPRLTYDRGVLEIMSPGKRHESLDRLVTLMMGALSEAWAVDVTDLGHLTFKHPAWERGFEPDGCFFLRDAAAFVRGVEELDPVAHPGPDIALEVDISRSSMRKLAIYAQFRVGEIWRHDGERATMLGLDEGEYHEMAASRALPLLTAARLTELLADGGRRSSTEWLAATRAWARGVRPSTS